MLQRHSNVFKARYPFPQQLRNRFTQGARGLRWVPDMDPSLAKQKMDQGSSSSGNISSLFGRLSLNSLASLWVGLS